jgi:hypothetical protein
MTQECDNPQIQAPLRPHREGAAVLAMVTDIGGANILTGGDDGPVA